MRNLPVFIAAFILLLSSCASEGDSHVTVLEESLRNSAEVILPDTVCTFSDTVISSCAMMIDGRYAALDMSDRTSYSLIIYDTETMLPVSHYLHYGNGPQEVLGTMVSVVEGKILVQDFSNRILYQIPCAEAVEGDGLTGRGYSFMSDAVLPYGNSLVAMNPYWFEDERLGISNGEPRLFLSDGTYAPYDETKLRSNTAMDAVLLSSASNSRIAYVDRTCPLVELYDDTLGLVRTVYGPGTEMPLYWQNGNTNIVWEELPLTTWQSACADDDYMYLLWNGLKDDQKVERPESYMYEANGEEKDLLLVVLDWDGNLVKAFRPKGLTSYAVLSTGEGGGVLYASTIDEDMTRLSILRYHLF